jgi:hypothetical protein
MVRAALARLDGEINPVAAAAAEKNGRAIGQ